MQVIIYIIIVIVLVLVILGLFMVKNKINLVSENSERLLKLSKLNESYKFNNNVKSKISITNYVTNKIEFSKVDLDELLKNEFFENSNNSFVNFESVYKNSYNYEEYNKKYKAIKNKTSSDVISITNLSEKMFYLIEKKLFKKRKVNPIVKTKINFVVKFDSLKEKNKYIKDKTYKFDELIFFYDSRK